MWDFRLRKSRRPTCFARLSSFSLMRLPKRLEKSLDGIDRGRMRWASAAFGCFSQVKVIVWLSCSEFLLHTLSKWSKRHEQRIPHLVLHLELQWADKHWAGEVAHLWVNAAQRAAFEFVCFYVYSVVFALCRRPLPAFSSLFRQPRVSPFISQTESD